MVYDAIENSLDRPTIRQSEAMRVAMNDLKDWMFEHVYEAAEQRNAEIERAKNVVRELFRHFRLPGTLPNGYEGFQGAIDYVAGMTDRFAIEKYRELHIPYSFDERIRTVP